mmetsp:Transcript_8774/g.28939  ORF Transcript_8774/g.28939 Transcript_8774/m.28939 type:complete len:80 (-) Transcript_8774:1239-1478(-)
MDGELAELVARIRRRPLPLVDDNVHRRLPVLLGGEGVGPAARDGSIALHDGRHHLARRLDAERQRHHIHQHQTRRRFGQ